MNEFTRGFVYKLSPFREKAVKAIQCDLLIPNK